MRPANSCELAGRRLSGQVRESQGCQTQRLENRHLWPIPYFKVVLLIDGRDKVLRLKIKSAVAAADNALPRRVGLKLPFKDLKAW
jgi:hypothetical protein